MSARSRPGAALAGFSIVAATLLGMLGVALAPGAGAAIPFLPGVVNGLLRSPVYVDPVAGPPHVDASRLAAVMPPATYFASLPRSDLSATSDAAAVPALLSSQVGRGGTFIVMITGRLYGASTTIPGRLGDDLAAAQAALSALPANADATGTLIALMRTLAGSGDLNDASGPARAGGPVGGAVIAVIVLLAAAGAAVLWWRLRRSPPRRRRARPPAPARDLVEIDYAGRIIRRVPAGERAGKELPEAGPGDGEPERSG